MKCCYCGAELDASSKCPECNRNVYIWKKVSYISNRLYNDGLSKAIDGDLYGAAEQLRLSLKYNKRNTEARNLLGLICYATGEEYEAVCQWEISTRFQNDDNPAHEYLMAMQHSSAQIDHSNLTIRKYNQALQYCKGGNFDLAMIQLKKVQQLNPRFVRGFQLSALLYMHAGRYADARTALEHALKVDQKNPDTLAYLEECKKNAGREGRAAVQIQKDAKGKKKKKKSLKERYRDFQENTALASLVNIIIGAICGAAVVSCLVIPGIRSSYQNRQSKELVTANETIASKNNEIKKLNSQIDTVNDRMKKTRTDSKNLNNTVKSYDYLLTAYTAYRSSNYTTAAQNMVKIDDSLLDGNAKKTYNQILSSCKSQIADYYYTQGVNQYQRKKYKPAVKQLKKAVGITQSLDSYRAAYYLAQSYEQLGRKSQAKKWYQTVADNSSSSELRTSSNNAISKLNGKKSSSNSTDNADSSTDTTGTADTADTAQ